MKAACALSGRKIGRCPIIMLVPLWGDIIKTSVWGG